MQEFDVVVVGGGPAGLSAALCLGRARKSVVVIDAGSPRHAVAEGVHNLITREGMPPAELRAVTWEQMRPYTSVEGPVQARVNRITQDQKHWVVESESGSFRCRAVVIATGVIDEHPEIPGYKELWGHSIHQCPFCHGWEVQDQPAAVIGAPEHLLHMAPMLSGWTNDIAVFSNGVPMTDEQKAIFKKANVPACDQPIADLRRSGTQLEEIVLENGSSLARSVIFSVTSQRQVPLVQALELELNEMGYIVVDEQLQTSRPGIWAAGDVTSRMQQVVQSAAQGLLAGAMITASINMSS